MPSFRPKITFDLQYCPGDRMPWVLRAYRSRAIFWREYVQTWWFASEIEAIGQIEEFRKIPLIQVFR
jgi:hypothetical protein